MLVESLVKATVELDYIRISQLTKCAYKAVL